MAEPTVVPTADQAATSSSGAVATDATVAVLSGSMASFTDDRRPLFSDTESLATYAPRFVQPALWTALVESIRERFVEPPQREFSVVFVLAEDPLLGLAATAAFAKPEIHIPMSMARRRRLERREWVEEAVSVHPQLHDFLLDCKGMPARKTPLLMLGWKVSRQRSTNPDLRGIAALGGGLVCLLDSRRNQELKGLDDRSLDISDSALDIVAGALPRLALPGLTLSGPDEAREMLVSLVREVPLDRLVRALNTPSHAYFLRHVQQLKEKDWPEVAGVFNRYVMGDAEDSPRHAASLFLVSHFSRLPPQQFIELGDALASETPAMLAPSDKRHAPDRLTDHVLAQCNIAFVATPQGDMFASLVPSPDARDEYGMSGGPERAERLRSGPERAERLRSGPERAERLRSLFEDRAPLLCERYFRYLGEQLMLGHPSLSVARDYIRHEARALRAAAASDERVSLAERLQRAVYGNALTGERALAAAPAASHASTRRLAFFSRALERAPELLEEFVGPDLDERLMEAVRTLCLPNTASEEYLPASTLRLGGAWLFWYMYAQYPGRVTLSAYLSFFQSGADDEALRTDCIRMLRVILTPGDDRNALDSLDGFERPELLAQLISDVVRNKDRIVNDTAETSRNSLLVEAWTQYLRRHLRGKRWIELAGWRDMVDALGESPNQVGNQPADLAFAQLLTSQNASMVADWIRQSEYRAAEGEGRDHENARALFELAPLIADAVVGCAQFGDMEFFALEIWLLLAMELPEELYPHLDFSSTLLWHPYAKPRGAEGEPQATIESEDEADISVAKKIEGAFRSAMDLAFALFPVVALMAMTHDSANTESQPLTFTFSDPLREWLAVIPRHSRECPARYFLSGVEHCLSFQKQWKKAHERLQLRDVDWRAVGDAMADRTMALNAFAEALEPIARMAKPAAVESRARMAVKSEALPVAANAPSPVPAPLPSSPTS